MATGDLFSPDLFDFLRQLKRHNERDWFARNKHRYQQVAVEPAMRFISGFAPHLTKLSPHFVADPRPSRGSLFRIHRDTRFSSDKSPYKTHVGIHFSHEKGKDAHAPVFYLHLEPGQCFAAAGVWHPDNPALTKIRSAIVRDPEQWSRVRRKLELDGDSLTRPPKGFDPKHPFIDDIKRKDFVASVALSEEDICGPQFMKNFNTTCRTMLPLVEFTTRALGLNSDRGGNLYCNACGKVIPDDGRLCSYCGQPVSGSRSELVRPRHGRRIAGVCLGVARRFGWNVTLLRIVWLLMFFFAGAGGLLYLILWIIMPSEA